MPRYARRRSRFAGRLWRISLGPRAPRDRSSPDARAVARRRWLAAGAGAAAIAALAIAATDLQLGGSDADTVAQSGDAKEALVALEEAGIGEGALLPHEVLV